MVRVLLLVIIPTDSCQILPLRVAQKTSLKRRARKRRLGNQVKPPRDVQALPPEEPVARNTSHVAGEQGM